MPTIAENLRNIRTTLPESICLVAVSKYHTVAAIREAYQTGQRAFGESRVQELREKAGELPSDIEWHFIGHLQPNKVKYIAPYIAMVHAVDTPKLLAEIHRQACKCERTIPCLLQLHVAAEDTKYGFSPEECLEFLKSSMWKELPNAKIAGIMCMATNTDDAERIKSDFHTAHAFFERVKQEFFSADPDFKVCSWGMSDDYPLAIAHGSTHVRIGSKIFDCE